MAGFSLTQFMSNNRDFARAYLFEASIKRFGSEDHSMYVKSTRLPEHTISEIEADFQGNKYKIAGTSEVQDFGITFNADPYDELRQSFVGWMSEIHNPANNRHGEPQSYMSDIILKHLNGQGQPIMVYALYGAWPKQVTELALDYSTKEIATFDVNFSYQYHMAASTEGGTNVAQIIQSLLSGNLDPASIISNAKNLGADKLFKAISGK